MFLLTHGLLELKSSLYIISVPDLVFRIWATNKEWCSKSFPFSRNTDHRFAVGFFILPNKSTSSIFSDDIKILGNGSRMFDLYWISEASISWTTVRENSTSSRVGTDCGCDVSTDVYGICIYCRGSCLVIHPDRLLEEADSSIQGLHQPHCRLYRSDLILALSLALGVLDQSLTIGVHWWSVPLQIALMIGLAVGLDG